MGIKKIKDQLMVGALVLTAHGIAMAQSLQLSDIKGSSGAGSNDLTNLADKGKTTFQKGIDLFLIGAAAVGIIIFVAGLYGLYKHGKDDSGRESPKGPIWAIFIGAALTCVAALIGYTRNTMNV